MNQEESCTLTKAELAELLFDRVGLNKREAKDIVDTFFEEIRESLARGVGEALWLWQFPSARQTAASGPQPLRRCPCFLFERYDKKGRFYRK